MGGLRMTLRAFCLTQKKENPALRRVSRFKYFVD
jgi:hypothetical protein